MADPLLSVQDLDIAWVTPEGPLSAVRGATLCLHDGELLGLIGESGSGKSTLARGLLRALPPPAVIRSGVVSLRGRDLLALDAEALRHVWGRHVGVVPQSAMDALNPMLTVRSHLQETLDAHGQHADLTHALAAMDLPASTLDLRAHQLSGGMRQRVILAVALALRPELLVLDEPTTALDRIVERRILSRLRAIQEDRRFGVLLVTHDLDLVRRYADRVAVMYAGRIVEVVDDLRRARHPYTRALMAAAPPDLDEHRSPVPLPGDAPRLRDPLAGCRFHPRCAIATASCRAAPEPQVRDGVACPVVAP